jgi:hypothetical protein
VSEMSSILGDCVQKSVAQNTVLQKLREKIDQHAAATAEGLNLDQLILLVAVVLGVPLAAAVGGFSVAGRYIFPLSLIAGAACLTLYSTWVTDSVYSHAFSPLISRYPDCGGVPLYQTTTSYPTSSSAAEACSKDEKCAAFDWIGSSLDYLGRHTPLTPPQTIFYKSVGASCETSITGKVDSTKMFRYPIFVKGTGSPAKIEGDVYLDLASTDYYFFNHPRKTWEKQGAFAHQDFTSRNGIDWGTVVPSKTTPGIAGSIYVFYDGTTPTYFKVFVKNPDGWRGYEPPLKGPGMIPDSPAEFNVSGFVTVKRKKWLLYLGAALITVGILGSIAAFKSKRRDE